MSMTESERACEPPSWTLPEGLKATWRGMLARRKETASKPPATGIDGVSAAVFERDVDRHLAEISRVLRRPSTKGGISAYRFAPLLERTIASQGNKERTVYIPRIRDQVVLRAIHDALAEHMRIHMPHAALPSPRRCAKRVISEARLIGRHHVARVDVRDFYPSIPHARLLDALKEVRLPPLAHALLAQLLTETPHRPLFADKSADVRRLQGVPTGTSVASQLAHLYMAPIDTVFDSDQEVTYIRFVDDILVAADERSRLEGALSRLHEALGERGLTVHRGKGAMTTFEAGFDFLGFEYQGEQVRVTQPRIDKWLRRLRSIHKAHTLSEGGAPDALIAALNREISGLQGRHIPYYSLADNIEAYREVDAQIRRIVGAVLRRADLKPSVLESAYGWARRYKRDYDAATARAKAHIGSPA